MSKLSFLFYQVEKLTNTLNKKERLNSKKSIELLFSGHASTLIAFPLRMIYKVVDKKEGEAAVSILISVPKKKFKRAVKRNYIKRQVREAYRCNKHSLVELMISKNQRLLIAFIFLDNKLYDISVIEKSITTLLNKFIVKNESE